MIGLAVNGIDGKKAVAHWRSAICYEGLAAVVAGIVVLRVLLTHSTTKQRGLNVRSKGLVGMSIVKAMVHGIRPLA